MTDVVCLLRGPLVPGSDSPAPVRIERRRLGRQHRRLAGRHRTASSVRRPGRAPTWPGRQRWPRCDRCGVDVHVSVDPVRPTGTCIVLVGADGERTMVPDTGANGAWSLDDLPTTLGPRTHLHVSGYALVNPGAREAALEAVRRARSAGATISVDTASAGPLIEVGAEHVPLLGRRASTSPWPTADEASAPDRPRRPRRRRPRTDPVVRHGRRQARRRRRAPRTGGLRRRRPQASRRRRRRLHRRRRRLRRRLPARPGAPAPPTRRPSSRQRPRSPRRPAQPGARP